jgi:hypothetical protein
LEVTSVASFFIKRITQIAFDLKKIGIHIFTFLLLSHILYAQETNYDALLNSYLASDSILLDELELQLASDSLDIFDLMDSLLLSDYSFSQLSVRTGYTSDITYAGRNFGFNQYGLNAGIAYYHKSGLFADVSGYWNSSLNPGYNPTITSLGYMGTLSHKWTYTLSYDHYFYNTQGQEDSLIYYPLTNSVNLSTFFDLGQFTLAGDYSFLFGEESAHRLRFNLMYTISKNNWGFIDRFVFMPSASILMGNATIYQINPIYPEWNLATRYDIRQIMFKEYGEYFIRYLWRNNREEYLKLEKTTYENYKDELTGYEYIPENKYGIMNYSLSAPFYFYINQFTLALSYIYNIPVALPGEELQLENNSYVGVSLIYNIPFKKK